jgi:hypothetical protein
MIALDHISELSPILHDPSKMAPVPMIQFLPISTLWLMWTPLSILVPPPTAVRFTRPLSIVQLDPIQTLGPMTNPL